MDRNEVGLFIDRHFKDLQAKMCLSHWDVRTILIESLDDDRPQEGFLLVGSCLPNWKNNKANIYIAYEAIENEAHLWETLLHELVHLYHTPFDMVYDSFKSSVPDEECFKTLISYAEERTVQNILSFLQKMFPIPTRGAKKYGKNR